MSKPKSIPPAGLKALSPDRRQFLQGLSTAAVSVGLGGSLAPLVAGAAGNADLQAPPFKGARLLPWPAGYVPSEQVYSHFDERPYPFAEHRVSETEIARRYSVTRDYMRERGLDCLLVAGSNTGWNAGFSNTRWISGYLGSQLSNYEYVIFPLVGEPTVLTIPMYVVDPGRRARPWVEDMRGSWGSPAAAAVERLKELKYDKGTIGIVTVDAKEYSVPLDHWRIFQQELPRAKFEFVTDWFLTVRSQRSEEELEFFRRSARIGDAMHRTIAEVARPGLNERELWGAVFDTMISEGGEVPTLIVIATFNMNEPGDVLHEQPYNRVLKKGDIILTEIAPRYPDGSECQTGRSFCLGEPPEAYQTMFEMMWQTYSDVVDAWQPGNTDADVRKASDPALDAGYQNLTPLVHGAEGGGVGGGIMVTTRDWANPNPPLQGFTIKENMLFTPEILISLPDMSKQVYVLDTWVTRRDGPECLHEYPQEVVII